MDVDVDVDVSTGSDTGAAGSVSSPPPGPRTQSQMRSPQPSHVLTRPTSGNDDGDGPDDGSTHAAPSSPTQSVTPTKPEARNGMRRARGRVVYTR